MIMISQVCSPAPIALHENEAGRLAECLAGGGSPAKSVYIISAAAQRMAIELVCLEAKLVFVPGSLRLSCGL